MTDNMALWLPSKRAQFTIGPAPMPIAGAGELVVRIRAVAINPIDRLTQTIGDLIVPYLKYPAVLGSDVAGEVVAVGAEVKRFRQGDRVVGYAAGSDKTRNRASEGGFQLYGVLLEHMTTPLPDSLPFEAASVLPLGISTAASALFQHDMLALEPPTGAADAERGTVLVWGGATSVGCNAIQLARAAGYDVVSTASPANFDMVKRLGARAVFDRRSRTVVADLLRDLRGRRLAGALAIGTGSAAPCIAVAGGCDGDGVVARATAPASFDDVPTHGNRLRFLIPAILRMMVGSLAVVLQARLKRVRTVFIWGSAPVSNEVGPIIFEQFLRSALIDGCFKPAPAPVIVGHGLEAIPAALARQRQGTSAAKLVVTL